MDKKEMRKEKRQERLKERGIDFTPSKVRITKRDWIFLFCLMILYSVFALYDLGEQKAPETQWRTTKQGDSFDIDLGSVKDIRGISYFLGNYEGREFTVLKKDIEQSEWTYVDHFKMESVFAWGTKEVSASARYLRFISDSDKAAVKEIVLTDKNGSKITPVTEKGSPEYSLFDEQDMFPKRSTFRNSTYFDEIYHARTAYEYIQGEYSYENTHPPLGKIFISLGIRLFGMNPFGWRIIGTLFGIAMIPFLFFFAKNLLRSSWVARLTTILFAFDFMHFAQTRIATIDVFVTFFIILMYYFMFRYYSMSFYDTDFKKTLIPLGLCGIAMGFGVACKWTGIYAGAGLAVIFFYTLYRRFKEYQYAKLDEEGSTNDISHAFVIKKFKKYTVLTLLFCVVFFVLIPAVIYLLSYVPFVDAAHNTLIVRMLKNQETMFNYHSTIEATHPYSSWWYQWPIMYRPIWYYSGHVSSTISEGISAFGNPLVWWLGIPAFFFMIYRFIVKEDKRAMFLVIGYLAQYLPWIFVSRITFIYHYFPSVPFVALMLGYSIYLIIRAKPKWKKAAYIYTGAAVVLFLMFYPVLSGQPVNNTYVSIFLRWFGSWVLV